MELDENKYKKVNIDILRKINKVSDIIRIYGIDSIEVKFILEHLHNAIEYKEENGEFYWKINYNNNRHKRKIGDHFYGKSGNVSVQIRYDNFLIYGHQLAFLYKKGYIPNIIDHINGNHKDNRIDNLRGVNRTINNRNMPLRIDNLTGIIGVSYDKSRNKWMSSITTINGKRIYKRFSNFFEACCYRKSLELKHLYHSNHGRGA